MSVTASAQFKISSFKTVGGCRGGKKSILKLHSVIINLCQEERHYFFLGVLFLICTGICTSDRKITSNLCHISNCSYYPLENHVITCSTTCINSQSSQQSTTSFETHTPVTKTNLQETTGYIQALTIKL